MSSSQCDQTMAPAFTANTEGWIDGYATVGYEPNVGKYAWIGVKSSAESRPVKDDEVLVDWCDQASTGVFALGPDTEEYRGDLYKVSDLVPVKLLPITGAPRCSLAPHRPAVATVEPRN